MNPLAVELNATIAQSNPHLVDMLSTLGKELFFPKGILSQSAEAKQKAKKFNATIGLATENGEAMHLSSIQASFADIPVGDLFPYAPAS